MALIVMAYIVMAYVVMAYMVMAYIVMAYVVMAFLCEVLWRVCACASASNHACWHASVPPAQPARHDEDPAAAPSGGPKDWPAPHAHARGISALHRLYIGIADDMSIARVLACRYSK